MTLLIIIRIIYEAYFRFPHFKILKAGMRKWVNKNSEELITYQIELKTKKPSSELKFEELWINEKKYKFFLTKGNRKIFGSFAKREILKLDIISEINNEMQNQSPAKSSRGMLVLAYTFRNKKKYISFKKFCNMDQSRLSGGAFLIG